MKPRLLSFVVLLTLFSGTIMAQLKGHITEDGSTPIPNAVVTIDGSSYTASSDANGYFEIRHPKGTFVLHISHDSYRTNTQTLNSAELPATLNITLASRQEQLNEVTVEATANRYAATRASVSLRVQTPIAEQPQNIQVIEKQTILDQGSVDMLEGVTRNVSGAQMIEHWGTFARINMRGFKIPAFRNGMNVDMPWGPLTEDMSIVDRIEFVKGPAGFMLTAGEPGGFYNIVTKKPVTKPIQSVDLMFGSFNQLRTAVDVGGSFHEDDRLTYRLNLMASTRGAHRDYEFNDRYTIAPSLSYRIDDRTSLTAEYIYQHSTLSVIGAAYVFSPNGYADLPRDFTIGEPNIDPSNIDEHSAFLHLEHTLNENWQLHGQLGYMNYMQIGSSLWPSSLDSNGMLQRSLSIWDALNTAYLGQLFLQGKEYTGPLTHTLLAGADFSKKNYYADWHQSGPLGGPLDIYNPVHSVPSAQIPVFDRSRSIRQRAFSGYFAAQSQQTAALYVQDEIGIMEDRVRLTVGGRLTSFAGSTYGADVDNVVFTPRIGLNVRLLENTFAYGLYDQSFLPQTGTDANGDAFLPVEATDLEGGLKTKWADGRWNATLGYFNITKRNVLTADPNNPNFSIQVGEVVSKGIEFDMQGEIVPGLNLILNYANTNVTVTEDTDESKIGTRLAGHAEHMTNGWLSYSFHSGLLRGFNISAGYQYQINRSTWSWGADNESDLPDYFRLDGAIGWSNDKFSINMNINNLLDDYLYSGAPYSNYYYWQAEPGTNFRMNFQYRF